MIIQIPGFGLDIVEYVTDYSADSTLLGQAWCDGFFKQAQIVTQSI
jgi:hypothetical protein